METTPGRDGKTNGTNGTNGKSHGKNAIGAAAAGLSMGELLSFDHHALEAVYRNASAFSPSEIDGDWRGRMLAMPGLPVGLSRLASEAYRLIWAGKRFKDGEGLNRLAGGLVKRLHFTVKTAPSRAGAFDAVHLDYDLPKNPWPVRRIKDELRRLSPTLLLGMMFIDVGQTPKLGSWFALER
jgi:hypothetical protein